MSEVVQVSVDQADSLLEIFPCPPLLSSQHTTWKGIHLAHYRQPPHETPQYWPLQHVLSLHLSPSGFEEQWWGDGQFSQKYLVEGDIGLYSANCPQRQRWQNSLEFIDLFLDPVLLSQTVDQDSGSQSIELLPHVTLRDPLIQQIALALKAELEAAAASAEGESAAKASQLYAESLANTLTVHLLRRYATQKWQPISNPAGLPRRQLEAVINYIQAHLEQNLSLSELAAIAQLSPHYFIQQFKQSTGKTPNRYVTACRIERAQRLLRGTEGAIAEIALQVGFPSQSYFTTRFRQFTGVTPKAYRDAL